MKLITKGTVTMHSVKDGGRPTLNMCTCGKVHFSYSSITFHFEAEEFISFATAVALLFSQYKHMHTVRLSSSLSSLHNESCH